MASDPTAANIDSLRADIQDAAVDFINACRTELRFPIIVTSALRSKAEQSALLKAKRTTTLASRHVVGAAFDVDWYGTNRDAVPQAVWQAVGPLGESYGFEWGGRWKSFPDVGHFQAPL